MKIVFVISHEESLLNLIVGISRIEVNLMRAESIHNKGRISLLTPHAKTYRIQFPKLEKNNVDLSF